MLRWMFVAMGKLIVLKTAVDDLGEFTGAFKQQEREQSWCNVLILLRDSFHHYQVTLWGNKARKWLGVFEPSQSRWYFCPFLKSLFGSIYGVLFFCAVIKSSVQISYHAEELELSSVRLGEGITFNCSTFSHFGLFSAVSDTHETWQDNCIAILFSKAISLFLFSHLKHVFETRQLGTKIGSSWPCVSAQPCDEGARVLLTNHTFNKNTSGGESSVTHMRLL